MIYRFGACTMDISRRVLQRHGAPVHIEPQAFELLRYLVEHRGRAVTKDELFSEIWGGRAVSDAVLTTRIRNLRRALDAPGSDSVIRTLHRVGYEFRATVHVDGAQIDIAPTRADHDALARPMSEPKSVDELRQAVVIALQPRLALDQPVDPERLLRMQADARRSLVDRLEQNHDAIVESVDGTLFALIGVRVTHADDLPRAARLALEMAETLSSTEGPIAFGVAAGNIARSGDTFQGDALLIAAQTVANARAGEVHLAANVASRMPDGATVEFEGAMARLVACEEGFDRAAPGAPFVGRAVELGLIDSAVQAMIGNNSGGCIVLEGPAGIGKSRLASRAIEMVEGVGGHHSLVLGRELGAEGTLHREILKGFLPLIGVPEPYLSIASPEVRPALQRVLEGAEARDSVFHSEALGTAIAEILRRISVDVPLLVVVEDVHLIDAQSRNLMLELAGICAEMKVILLVTSRSSAKPFLEDIASRADGDIVALALGPLSRRQAQHLVQALAPGIDPDTATRLAERAGGNALFLTRIVEAFRKQGNASLDAVPDTIQSVIQVQFDQLDTARRVVLRKLSILGERFETHVAGIVYGDALVRDAPTPGFLRQAGTWHQFAHSLVRESIYASLPKVQRQRLHTEAAKALVDYDPLLAAEHAMLGDLAVAPEICVHVARDTFHFRRLGRSVGLIERAIELDCTPDQRAQLEVFLGSSNLELHNEDAAMAHFEHAAALALSSTPAVLALVRTARIHCRHYNLDAARDALDTATGWIERDPGPGYLSSEIAEVRSVVAWLGRDLAEAARQGEQAVRLSDHPHSTGRGLKSLALSQFSLGRFEPAWRNANACLALVEEKNLRLVEPDILAPALRIHWYADPGERRLEEANAVVRRADEIGISQARLQTRCVRLEIAWELGDRDTFLRDLHMLNAELGPQFRLSRATVAFFETLQGLRDGHDINQMKPSAFEGADRDPAFLPLSWLLSRSHPDPVDLADIEPAPHERLWLARLRGDLGETANLGLDDDALRATEAWRQFALAHPTPDLS